jgi:hypothetical protein
MNKSRNPGINFGDRSQVRLRDMIYTYRTRIILRSRLINISIEGGCLLIYLAILKILDFYLSFGSLNYL